MRTLVSGLPAQLLRIVVWSAVIMAVMEITQEAFYRTEAGAATFVFCYVAFGLCITLELARRGARVVETFVGRYWVDEARHASAYASALRVCLVLFGSGFMALLLRFSREAGFVHELENFSLQMGELLLVLGAIAVFLVWQVLQNRPAPVVDEVGLEDAPAAEKPESQYGKW